MGKGSRRRPLASRAIVGHLRVPQTRLAAGRHAAGRRADRGVPWPPRSVAVHATRMDQKALAIDPRQVAFFVPPGLKKFKQKLFDRIANHIAHAGGRVVRDDHKQLVKSVPEFIPIVGCSPPFAGSIRQWQADGTPWIYWDRGYLRRVFATWLPKGSDMGLDGGFYRWQVGSFQMLKIRDVPDDRWRALRLDRPFKINGEMLAPLPHEWHRGGRHIVVAHTLADYWDLRGLSRDWSLHVAEALRRHTDRPIIVRDKESKVPLHVDLAGAHALVTHGSIAAVEAVALGYPVFVDYTSAAALVGRTDLAQIENPHYAENRLPWLASLCYSQFHEQELVDGTLWRLIE